MKVVTYVLIYKIIFLINMKTLKNVTFGKRKSI